MGEEEKKASIAKFISENTKPKAATRKRKPAAKPAPGSNIQVQGNGNNTAGRDLIVTQKTSVTNRRVPAPGGLTGVQQNAVRAVIDELVERELAGDSSGDLDAARKRAYAKWYRALNKRFEQSSYLDIPSELGDAAVAWLKQQRAIKRTKLRRNAPEAWKKDAFTAIWSRARELGLSKGEVYALVSDRLDKQVSSLTQLGEQALDRLRQILAGMKPRKSDA